MPYINGFTAKTQLRLSPFFERTSQLNESQEWKRWSGHLAATSYELSHHNEYFAIRTKAGLLDVSPLKKYIFLDQKSFAINWLTAQDESSENYHLVRVLKYRFYG